MIYDIYIYMIYIYMPFYSQDLPIESEVRPKRPRQLMVGVEATAGFPTGFDFLGGKGGLEITAPFQAVEEREGGQ